LSLSPSDRGAICDQGALDGAIVIGVARVLVAEEIAESGLQALRDAGHEVDIRTGMSEGELLDAVPGAHALIIRSSTQVTADVLAVADQLVVVGRAGIGLDNVDVPAATAKGVLVVNAPQSNTLSAAEHTMALLLAQARNVPQAHSALVQGRWERSKWNGVELSGKTLGIVGLGQIGRLVAQRAHAFGMRLVAYDPFVSEDSAKKLSVAMVSLDEIAAEADFLTLHLAKTPETLGLIGTEFLAKAKPNLRVINVARGGIVDEAALAAAVEAGQIAGAAIDVFDSEPTTESPLFALDSVVVTPHLGASTQEAQDKAGVTIAEQVQLALANEFVPFAVNIDAAAVAEDGRPFIALAETLGRLFGGLVTSMDSPLDITYQGEVAEHDTRLFTLAVLKGFFGRTGGDPVSYVNAPQRAEAAGIDVRETVTQTPTDYVDLITVSSGDRSISAMIDQRGDGRLVEIDGYSVDVPPAEHMLLVRNEDIPGMIGLVGTILGEGGINIDDMRVGRDRKGEPSIMVISTARPVVAGAQKTLLEIDGVLEVVSFS